jgi:phosphoribosylcarboxyaminoimidazole (NCAIR) mutase
VATASALVARDVSYIAWVGTAQRAMRRGLGDAVTRAATTAGLELGAAVTALLASPMGAPVYRRMGFDGVGHLTSRVAMPTGT